MEGIYNLLPVFPLNSVSALSLTCRLKKMEVIPAVAPKASRSPGKAYVLRERALAPAHAPQFAVAGCPYRDPFCSRGTKAAPFAWRFLAPKHVFSGPVPSPGRARAAGVRWRAAPAGSALGTVPAPPPALASRLREGDRKRGRAREEGGAGAWERETVPAGEERTRDAEEARQTETRRQNPNSTRAKSPGAEKEGARELRLPGHAWASSHTP